MKLYNNEAVDNLAMKYIEKGGEVIEINAGCLLTYGLAVFICEGYKTVVVKDKFLNAWNSAYIVKCYNKIPKKYQVLIDNHI